MSSTLDVSQITIKQVFKHYQLFWNSIGKTVVVYTKTKTPEAFSVSREDAVQGVKSAASIRDHLLYSEVLDLYAENQEGHRV